MKFLYLFINSISKFF